MPAGIRMNGIEPANRSLQKLQTYSVKSACRHSTAAGSNSIAGALYGAVDLGLDNSDQCPNMPGSGSQLGPESIEKEWPLPLERQQWVGSVNSPILKAAARPKFQVYDH